MKALSTIVFLCCLTFSACSQHKSKINPEAKKLNDQAINIWSRSSNNTDSMKKALVLLNKSVAIDSGYLLGYMNKFGVETQLKYYKKALSTAKKIYNSNPQNPLYSLLIGAAYDRTGDSLSARKYYNTSFNVYKKIVDTMSISNRKYQGLFLTELDLLTLLDRKKDADKLFSSYLKIAPDTQKEMLYLFKPKTKKDILYPDSNNQVTEEEANPPKRKIDTNQIQPARKFNN